jgi:hypothetical protein
VTTNTDAKHDALVRLGYSGDTDSMETTYYLANGATSNSRTDAEREFLLAKPGIVDSSNTDMWNQFLSATYAGSVDDMLRQYWNSLFFLELPEGTFMFNGTYTPPAATAANFDFSEVIE